MHRLITQQPPSAPKVSFEFFPPKTDAMQESLWETIRALEPLKPSFVSVTYGAGGSTRERTHQTVSRILQETGLIPAAHLTCVGASREEVNEVAESYWEAGVRHIVALRGDPVEGTGCYTPHPGGYPYAADLVAGLKKLADFEITVAAYPERHPESSDWAMELDNLERKVDAGATRAITQYFFEPHLFADFKNRLEQRNISIPLVPGILPVTNVAQMLKFSGMCGTAIPSWMQELFEGLDEKPETRQLVAAMVAIEQCRLLQKEAGCEEFHFYTLNRAPLVMAICHMLGVKDRNIEVKSDPALS